MSRAELAAANPATSSMDPLAADVAVTLGGATPAGDGWMSRCPAHNDSRPSLSLRNDPRTGRLLWRCHAGCSQSAVKAALEARGLYGKTRLEASALHPPKHNGGPGAGPWSIVAPVPGDAPLPPTRFGKLGEPSRRWAYTDAQGRLLCYELRFDRPGRDKEIRPLTCWSDGHRYEWCLQGFPPPIPLYGLAELTQRSAAPVLVVEGAKTADAARRMFPEFVVATWMGGAGNTEHTAWTPLRGRNVTIWPDHDDPGAKAAQDVARHAHAAGAASIAIVPLPDDLPAKWDLADPLPDGWDAEQLRGLLDAAVPWQEAPAAIHGADEWPELQPLPTTLPPVAAFDPALLPISFRSWIEDISARIQCPPDFPAVAAMVVLAAVVGRQVGIRPQLRDDWLVVAILWGMVVGRPGVLKTPAMREPMILLEAMERAAALEFASAKTRWDATQVVESERHKVQRESVREALRKNQPTASIVDGLLQGADPQPVRRRWIVNDTTVEKLGELLNQNPNGLLLFRDELNGFLRTLDREGYEGARAFYLEAWAGNGRFTYDRIGRGTLDIESACVSILGSIQPGPLTDYVRATVGGGAGDDGLLQRFQLTVWPDVASVWRNTDRAPNTEARTRAHATLHRLAALDPIALGAERDDHSPIPFLRFAPDAYEAFIVWRTELEHRVRSGNELPALEAHLAKYRSLVPSLALLIHLADGATGPVSLAALKRALGWASYLEGHARRLYSPALLPELTAAVAVHTRILAGDLAAKFRVRDVYRKCWTGLTNQKAVEAALSVLEAHGHVRLVQEQTGGRPSEFCEVNPKLLVKRDSKKAHIAR